MSVVSTFAHLANKSCFVSDDQLAAINTTRERNNREKAIKESRRQAVEERRHQRTNDAVTSIQQEASVAAQGEVPQIDVAAVDVVPNLLERVQQVKEQLEAEDPLSFLRNLRTTPVAEAEAPAVEAPAAEAPVAQAIDVDALVQRALREQASAFEERLQREKHVDRLYKDEIEHKLREMGVKKKSSVDEDCEFETKRKELQYWRKKISLNEQHAINQASHWIVIGSNLLETLANSIGFNAIRTSHLGDNMQEAIDNGDMDIALRAYATHPKTIEILQHPAASFGISFVSVVAKTHSQNIKKEKEEIKKRDEAAARRAEQSQEFYSSSHPKSSVHESKGDGEQRVYDSKTGMTRRSLASGANKLPSGSHMITDMINRALPAVSAAAEMVEQQESHRLAQENLEASGPQRRVGSYDLGDD